MQKISYDDHYKLKQNMIVNSILISETKRNYYMIQDDYFG